MHYSKILLENFRGFSGVTPISLAPLTFLVGPNSSGKSSVFDALLLISQSGFSPTAQTAREPNWQGAMVDLGSYKDTVYRHDIERDIRITTEVKWDEGDATPIGFKSFGASACGRFEMRLSCAGRNDPIGRLAEMRVTDVTSGSTLAFTYPADDPTKAVLDFHGRKRTRKIDVFSPGNYYFRKWLQQAIAEIVKERIDDKVATESLILLTASSLFSNFVLRVQRISSGRLGPKRWYPATGLKSKRALRSLYDGIDPQMMEEIRHPNTTNTQQPRSRIRQSIARILKALEIASEVKDVQLSPYHNSISVKDSITKVVSNLIDVGYGASQVMPVIIGCLSRSTSPLLVEQPEIHLHPKAQGTVAELLCMTSKERQIIIETHSEHMINRARILVAEGKLLPSDVLINYIKRDKDGSTVEPIRILENGDFSQKWPEGFFDERYNDTMHLLDLKNKKAKRKSR